MSKICYVEKNFGSASLAIIEMADRILTKYNGDGLDLTLRQLYYQFIARDWFPESWIDPKTGTKNNDKNYKRLGAIVNDARLAGMLDWEHLIDRTRNVRENNHWSNPQQIMSAAAHGYALDRWKTQEYRPEIWVEKDALIGVLEGPCEELDVPYFSCRGYVSQSEMYAAAQRAGRWFSYGQTPIIFHLGDHDPSGKDMTRDIRDRLNMFLAEDCGEEIEVKRLALTWEQIQRYQPPPNPAKLTDARADAYVREFGTESWELDALDPTVIRDLIESAVLEIRDEITWDTIVEQEEEEKELLQLANSRWSEVATYLRGDQAA